MFEDPFIEPATFDDTTTFTIENPCERLGFRLSSRNRIVAFFIIFVIGLFIWILNFPFIVVFIAAPYLFLSCYTTGLFLVIISTFFLYSPLSQIKQMKQPLRFVDALMSLLCFVMIVLGLFLLKSSTVVLFFMIIQMATTVFYTFSLLPFTTKCILDFCKRSGE
ncbi:Vesicle transport protein [Entamoeba marina]